MPKPLVETIDTPGLTHDEYKSLCETADIVERMQRDGVEVSEAEMHDRGGDIVYRDFGMGNRIRVSEADRAKINAEIRRITGGAKDAS